MTWRSDLFHPEFVRAAIGLLAAVGPPGLSPKLAMARAEVVWFLMNCGTEGATLRELRRRIRSVSPADLGQLIDDARARGEIEAVPVKSGPKGGRPTTRYRYVRRDPPAHESGADANPPTTRTLLKG